MNISQQVEQVKSAIDSGGEVFAVHYASESFSEAQQAPMAISAIAIFDVQSESTTAFSRLDTQGDDLEAEISMLRSFYVFISTHRDAIYLHWNMGSVEFGFQAIAKRFHYLTNENPAVTSPREQFNIDKMIRAMHGEDYAPHRRFESIGRLNNLDLRGFLAGPSEADAFTRKLWGDIIRSTSTKSKLIAKLAGLLISVSLRTSNSAGMFSFGGEQLDAASTVLQIGRKFANVQRAMNDRHGSRPPLEFIDEYDDQYLMHALLTLFFDDIRPEDYAPSYAGGNSRVDFLLPQHGLAIELKHTRASMTAKELGEQLIIDRDRYVTISNANHLIALVFDPGHRIDNPRGLEADLQRDIGTTGLAVTVKIYDA